MHFARIMIALTLAAVLVPSSGHAQLRHTESTVDSARVFHGRTAREWALIAATDTSTRLRAVARLALSRMGQSASDMVPLLTEHLSSNSAEIRIAAAWALADVGELAAPAVPVLATMTTDTVVRASAFALVALRYIGSRHAAEALPAVREVLHSSVPGLRGEAVATLVALDSAAALPDLVGMLDDTDRWVRIAAMEALGSIGERAGSAIPALTPFVSDTALAEADAALKALERILPDPPGSLRHIPLMAEVRNTTEGLRNDGRGAYVNGVDGVNAVVPLALNLMTYCPPTEECDTHTKNIPIGGPRLRALHFDLSSPVAGSGAEPLGHVVDHEGIMRVFWKREGNPPRPLTIQQMPVSDADQPVERVQFELMIDGRPHVLQFGPWGMGSFNAFGVVTGGEGTTTASVRRTSPYEWIASAPAGSIGRLWDISDPDNARDRGLYHFAFDVRFAQLAPHLFKP